MQNIAMSWLVYSLTKSALMLGLVCFAGQIPTFLFTPFAGVLADRYHRKSILIVTQTLSLIQAFALALLVLTGKISVMYILPLSIFLGLVNALDMPTRQSFVVDMIENKEDLGNAIALNSSMFNSARLLGPSIAGLIISAIGVGACFLVNGFSYLMVIGALLAMRGIPKEERGRGSQILQELKEGFLYAFDFSLIRWIILILGLISLVGMPYAVLMPIFAREILHGGPSYAGIPDGFCGFWSPAWSGFFSLKRKYTRSVKTNSCCRRYFRYRADCLFTVTYFMAFLLFNAGYGFGHGNADGFMQYSNPDYQRRNYLYPCFSNSSSSPGSISTERIIT
ncbi:MAG: Arabinose efflux permease [Desulfotomaculum sp. 46_80]|nr:MAG: Arabinose efflux permease [Desulfotomaculum sp. 46_80]